jgi:UDP-N-acetylglucosamine 4,6-dehydratase/5-epimerase
MNLKNKILLITGGTGSFGNAVLDKFLNTEIKEIRIFSRDEKKQHDMRIKYSSSKLKFYIGDVRNFDSINSAMINVDYVFQAAALKQVPSCEFFPMEATYTNIIGTHNVIKSAVHNKVKKIICLSTDKAAYPINAMGISKAMMEKVAIAESRNIDANKTVVCVTRYGNVMASRGSVIPHFVNQIKSNLPLTITDPKMTRFLMSLDDAVNLVMYAFENGNQGDLFVQKSPASTIKDLAIALQEIFKTKSKIQVIGTRHGEKLYETLCTVEEINKSVDLEGYFKIPSDNRDLNYENFFEEGKNKNLEIQDYNSHNTTRLDIEGIKKLLLKLDFIKANL